MTGTTAPGATVDIDAVNIDIDGTGTAASTTAGGRRLVQRDVTDPAGTT